ncbi:YdcF family protein [Hymenobacter cellulosivorans]|uniref:YdcF family protein n=1 Tax=Hymenobacter cellulosivorans TaxID=2932249 RepID=A0ABY4FBT5_9BACT|nr:YdcF family protein [Hymenobacter cellulosivorans]UOQ51911.1 YdcF family protein [Hymenobacter cellulosivorans]
MKIRRLVYFATALLAAWFLLHTGFVVADGLTDTGERAEVGVILGNTVNPDGTLSERLRQRLNCGLHLYQKGRVQRLLVSGGLGKEGFYEGSKMREYLRQHGVPDSLIVVDNKGNTTGMTVQNTLRLQDSLGFRRLLAVSQYYHLTRTKMLFRKAGFTQISSVSPRYVELRDGYSLAREFVGFYQQLLF